MPIDDDGTTKTLDADAEAEAALAPRQLAPPRPTPSATPAFATKRLGRYELILPLAEGGMGAVYAARLVGEHGVDRIVAIKTLRSTGTESERDALLREARVTARLHHRNIVSTLDLGEAESTPYVVMELVHKVSLTRLLASLASRSERMSPALAGWIVMQAAVGLDAAHELTSEDGAPLALIHRDVSPHNILLSIDGQVKVADFGIAKWSGRGESTETGVIKGKFAYMSPEQASDGSLDRRSDIFALGVVLWEALAGKRLFASDTPARTLARVMEHRPAPPLDREDPLSAIVLRCLEKRPEDRFATCAELAEALRAAIRQGGAPPDEAELGALVRRLFASEIAMLRGQLDIARPAPAPQAPPQKKRYWLALLAVPVLAIVAPFLQKPAATPTPPAPVISASASASEAPAPPTPPTPSAPAVASSPAPVPKPKTTPKRAPAAPTPKASGGMFESL